MIIKIIYYNSSKLQETSSKIQDYTTFLAFSTNYMNFIVDFLKNKLDKQSSLTNNVFGNLKKENIDSKNNKFEKKELEKEERKNNIISNRKIEGIEKDTNKTLGGYLGNDTNLDNTIKNMNEMEKDLDNGEKAIKSVKNGYKSDNKNIKIEKQKPYKNLFWIFVQFLLGIILIIISAVHINANVAEYKFIKSSIDLWTNTFNGIVSKFGGIVGENAKETYIKKREELVSSLISMQDKLDSCKKEGKKEIENKLSTLKSKLTDADYLTLQEFIDNYDNYKIAVDGIKESVNSLCNN